MKYYYAAHYKTPNRHATQGDNYELARNVVAYESKAERDADVAEKHTYYRPVDAVKRSECTKREIQHALLYV